MGNTRKGMMLILDGLGDRGAAVFDGETPLSAADTPNLDRLLSEGEGGLLDPLYPGVPVGTHTGTAALLGVPVKGLLTLGRGPVEAAGVGLEAAPGDVVLRCNFATLEGPPDALRVRDRRAGRIRDGTAELALALDGFVPGEGIEASLRAATQHRAVLRLSGPGLGEGVCDTDPGVGAASMDLRACRAVKADDSASRRTADAVNAFVREAHRRLQAHPVNRARVEGGLAPANGVITRGAGRPTPVASLVSGLGVPAAVVTGESTVRGLARLLGFTLVSDERFTALPDTDLAAKVAAASEALRDHDLVFLHIKGPDICSHDKDPAGKRALIERIDAAIGGLVDSELVIGVTGDHSTDCNTGRHCGDPVPTIVRVPGGRRDALKRFDELNCAGGGLGRLPALGFLSGMLDAMGAMHQYRPPDVVYFE